MERQRRRTFLEAIHALGVTDSDDENDAEEEEEREDSTSDSDEEGALEEEAEADIEVFSDSEESEESQDEEEANDDLTCPSGIRYSKNPIPPALRRRNILRETPRSRCNPLEEREAFALFHVEEITSIILRETNRKVVLVNRQQNCRIRKFNRKELNAAIAILLRAGVNRDNFTETNQLWNPTDSRPFYRATLGLTRFKQFLRCVRFDNVLTRAERQADDRLAAIKDVWLLFLHQLKQHVGQMFIVLHFVSL